MSQPSADFDAAIAELRTRSAPRAPREARRRRSATGRASCTRPASSTRADRRTGRFLQLLHDGPADVDIPGAPYTFTTLKNAQAIGDLQTLRELGLPAERVRLDGDDPARGAARIDHDDQGDAVSR